VLALAASITNGSDGNVFESDGIIQEEHNIHETEPGLEEEFPEFFKEAIIYNPTSDTKGRSDLTRDDVVVDVTSLPDGWSEVRNDAKAVLTMMKNETDSVDQFEFRIPSIDDGKFAENLAKELFEVCDLDAEGTLSNEEVGRCLGHLSKPPYAHQLKKIPGAVKVLKIVSDLLKQENDDLGLKDLLAELTTTASHEPAEEDLVEIAQSIAHTVSSRMIKQRNEMKPIKHWPPRNREELVQFAKSQRLFSHLDINFWGMARGVNPAETNLIMTQAGVDPTKSEHFMPFSEEMHNWGYETGAAFERDPNNPDHSQDIALIAKRHEMHDARETSARTIEKMDQLIKFWQEQNPSDIEAAVESLPDEEKSEVYRTLEKTMASASELEEASSKIQSQVDEALQSDKQPDEPACSNTPDWRDGNNNDCKWYMHGDRCTEYGEKEGANENCCVCLEKVAKAELRSMETNQGSTLLLERWRSQQQWANLGWRSPTPAPAMTYYELARKNGWNTDEPSPAIKTRRFIEEFGIQAHIKATAYRLREEAKRARRDRIAKAWMENSAKKWAERQFGIQQGRIAMSEYKAKHVQTSNRLQVMTSITTDCGISPSAQINARAFGLGAATAKINFWSKSDTCAIPGMQCVAKDENTIISDWNSCSQELGRTQTGLSAMGKVTNIFSMISDILNGGMCGNQVRKFDKYKKKHVTRATQYCKKGLKKVIGILTDVIKKVETTVKGVPVLGTIVTLVRKMLVLFEKFMGVIGKVMRGLSKIDQIVQTTTRTVERAKTQVDNGKVQVQRYYRAIKNLWMCPKQVCHMEEQLNRVLEPPRAFLGYSGVFMAKCSQTLKDINDGPLAIFISLGNLIEGITDALAPVFDIAQKVLDLVGSLVSKIGEAIAAVKCCLPKPLQMIMNAISSIIDVALCPVMGTINGMSEAVGAFATAALMKLAAKIVPDIKYEVPDLGLDKGIVLNVNHPCGHGRLSFNYKLELYGGLKFNLRDGIENAAGDIPSLDQLGGIVVESIKTTCKKALESFKDITHTCDCPVPVIGPILNCFPSTATVTTSMGTKRIADLKVGECVRSRAPDGSLIECDEVYMFGHADHVVKSAFQRLTLGSGTSMSLSPEHFIHTAERTQTNWKDAVMKYAKDVSVGEFVWLANTTMDKVVTNEMVELTGAFNPYTKSGNIIVDNVVASAHSNWFLDDSFQSLPTGSEHYLPTIYQGVLTFNRVMHSILGPAAAETLGLANPATGATFWINNWASIGPVVYACLLAIGLGAVMSTSALWPVRAI
jgi:hypothetical protein